MISPFNSKFLSPTKLFRRLSVMLSINEKPHKSQHAIGLETHLSGSMVNNYIKTLKREGLLRVSGKTNRTQRYHLTPEGDKMLRGALLSYSAEIVQMYGTVKRELANILHGFYDEGIRTVVLFGAAETAEIVHAALKETRLAMVGVVDSDPAKHGRPFNGLMIKSPESILKIAPDAVVITSFGRQEEIYGTVKKVVGKGIQIKKLSDINT
jgi:DNA-binding MarR family transcriptional regulator